MNRVWTAKNDWIENKEEEDNFHSKMIKISNFRLKSFENIIKISIQKYENIEFNPELLN